MTKPTQPDPADAPKATRYYEFVHADGRVEQVALTEPDPTPLPPKIAAMTVDELFAGFGE